MTPLYITSASDLKTSTAKTVEGFAIQAKKKKEIAKEYFADVVQLKNALSSVKIEADLVPLITNPQIRRPLISASGLSDKAQSHLSTSDINNILKSIFLSSANLQASVNIDEIVFRYLLTKGDSLGGSMRNWIGAQAGRKLTARIIKFLRNNSIQFTFLKSDSGKITQLKWNNRTLLFDVKMPQIGKNVDSVLLDSTQCTGTKANWLSNSNAYLACGELKGGIDPAGADEHWKTAKSALDRINTVFSGQGNPPKLFFIGAAIESSMAVEIYNDLNSGKLTHAANLTNDIQLTDLVEWLLTL